MVNAGWSGSATTQWLGATEAHSPATLLPGVAAHLVPVALGTNDFDTSQDPDAVFGPNLGLLLDAMPAGADVLLVAAVPPVDDRTWPWSAYVDAMFAIAQARGIAMIDMSRAIGSHAEMLAADMIVDRLHQNTAGSADQAAATFTLLSN